MSSPVAESEIATADGRPERPTEGRQPAMLVPVWWLLGLLLLVEVVYEITAASKPHVAFGLWIQAFLQIAATILCFARAVYVPTGRRAWLCIGTALACWAIGTVIWDVRSSSDPNLTGPTISDALWLAWYPLIALGLAALVKERVARFELYRWMDGLAVMLVVLAPAVALIVAPAAQHSGDGGLAIVLDYAYPSLDVLLVGAILGVCGLLAWRPGRTWILLGLGCVVIALADGIFAVQAARDGLLGGDYDFLWSGGALLIAFAAWASLTRDETSVEVYGWRAILLPVTAQICAGGIVIYSFFHRVGGERPVTLILLVVGTIQIVVSRPRHRRDKPEDPA